MIEIRTSSERGHANHGWLDAYHTFSFAEYHDPRHVHFGPLRVLNQDRIAAGRGFPTHGHRDMEIVTWVLDGVLEHRDSMGNGEQMRPGEVQVMSAGSGVMHSEFNASETDELHLLQMWVFPRTLGSRPRYEQKLFPRTNRQGRLQLVVSGDGRDGSLRIDQDAELLVGRLAEGEATVVELPADRDAWIHLARGRATLNELPLEAGDGAGIRGERRLELRGLEDAEVVLWQLPAAWDPASMR